MSTTELPFLQILEQKIRQQVEQEILSSSEPSPRSMNTEIPSELWTHLVGQLSTKHFQTPSKGEIYHRHRPPPRPRPDHKLDCKQKQAFLFFELQGAALATNFSSKDLQRAFRQLALRLHPDHGGSAERIQRLLEARVELLRLFD
jgi:hypothetical protein